MQFDMTEEDVEELIRVTKGYSGADLNCVAKEAAYIPLREVTDVLSVDMSNIRPLKLNDFKEALKNVKASVNDKDLGKFLQWNEDYGSFPMKEEDLAD